jgi:hypothetical protein
MHPPIGKTAMDGQMKAGGSKLAVWEPITAELNKRLLNVNNIIIAKKPEDRGKLTESVSADECKTKFDTMQKEYRRVCACDSLTHSCFKQLRDRSNKLAEHLCITMALKAVAGAGTNTLSAFRSACRVISFSTRQLKRESGKATGDDERGSLQKQLSRGDAHWKWFSQWYALFGTCARNQVQDRATESITPMKQPRVAQEAANTTKAVTQRQDSGEVKSPVQKRLRPARPVSLVQTLIAQGMADSDNSEAEDDSDSAELVCDTAAPDASQDGDSSGGPSNGVKDPPSVAVKKERQAGRRNSRTQVRNDQLAKTSTV